MPLEEYHAKRKFDETPEPQGGQGSGPLRFVVQKHDASRLHYDFRLEMNGILRSWAIPKGPSLNPQDKRLAMMTEDHPYDYRTFEGIIPKGNYGAGSVIVWDEGTYEPLAWDEKTGKPLELSREEQDKLARQGVHAGHLTFIMHGHKLNGEFALIKIKNGEEKAWLLVKAHKDEFVSEAEVTQHAESVITGRTVEEVAEGAPETELHLNLTDAPEAPMPQEPKPMLATLAKTPFDDPDWIYEVKWDGYRILGRITPDGVTLITRGEQDYTDRYQVAANELHALQVPAVIDGEMTVVDHEGRPSFHALQDYMRTGEGHLLYYAFDLLYLDGHDLTGLPLSQRKELLRRILPQGDHVKYSDHIAGQGTALLESVRAQNLEGVIAKRASSTYQLGRRSQDWLKLKVSQRQEAVIIGYTNPRGSRQYFGALILGVYQQGQLIYTGHTGTGFDDATLRDIYDQLQPLRRESCPVKPVPKTNEPATWLEPKLVAEISFTEWTADGSMRHPVFVGLREDKAPEDVVHEVGIASEDARQPATPPKTGAKSSDDILDLDGRRVKLSHRSKVFWPEDGITKGQLLDYYLSIAPTILPYLRDRPESLNRFPNGIHGASFYQKDMKGEAPEWARTTIVHSDSNDDNIEYLLCQDESTLAYMINLGCIELNPWNSRIQKPQHPDWCVIDLDPEDIGFDAVIKTAQTVHLILDELKIPAYPKTSGATGIHIYIPLGANYDYDQSRLFGQLIANLTHARLPEITSIERQPRKRQGKIYLDFLQNRRGQTLASAYSVRPRPGATVSTPLHWDEVMSGLSPSLFTIHNTRERLSQFGDIWQPVIGSGIDLAKILSDLQEA